MNAAKKNTIFSLTEHDLQNLMKTLKVRFNDSTLLFQALTHKSYANEMGDSVKHNERLEFLGDSVLGLIINEYLYLKFNTYAEGELAKIKSVLVSDATLAERATALGLGRYIQIGHGEEKSGGRRRKALLEDVFEALIGAIYLDQGFETTKEFALRVFDETFERIREDDFYLDYKTLLQEKVQKKMRITPHYVVALEQGPDHDREFHVEVSIKNKVMGKGVGKNKKEAEQQAAKTALQRFH